MNVRKLFTVAIAAASVACVDSGIGPSRGDRAAGNVGLTFGVMGGVSTSAFQPNAVNGAPSFSTSAIVGDTLVVSSGSDTMRITEVLLTIEEIELENDGGRSMCSDSLSRSDSSSRRDSTVVVNGGVTVRRGRGSDDGPGDDSRSDSSGSRSSSCNFVGGPVLIDLNLDGSGTSQITVPATLGLLDTLQFDFDVADESTPAHAEFRAAHPEMANASARITGTFNGTPFQVKLDSRLKYEVALTMPLEVTESSTGFELAIKLDVGAWLTRPGGSLINPNTLCSLGSKCADREIIEENMDNARVRADGRRRGGSR